MIVGPSLSRIAEVLRKPFSKVYPINLYLYQHYLENIILIQGTSKILSTDGNIHFFGSLVVKSLLIATHRHKAFPKCLWFESHCCVYPDLRIQPRYKTPSNPISPQSKH